MLGFCLYASFVLLSQSIVSNSLRPYGPQHARPPYPSPAPRVHPNPCLQCLPEFAQIHVHWVSDAIQPSHPLLPFSLPSIFAASGSFPMSWLFTSSGRSIDTSVSASVLPMSIYSRLISFRIDWFDLLAAWSKSESHSVISDYIVRGILWPQNTGVGSHSLLQGIFPTLGSNPDLWHCRWTLYLLNHQGSPACCPRNSQESSLAPLSKNISSSVLSLLYGLTLTSEHHYLKNHFSDYTNNVGHVMSLLFNMLSRFVIVFLQRTNHLFISAISWLQTPSAVIFKPKKIKSVTVSTFSSCICHEFIGLETMILVF